MTLVEGEPDAVTEKICQLAAEAEAAGRRVGIICTDETFYCYPSGICHSLGSRENLDSVAHNLYDILRSFDEEAVEEILSETFSSSEFGSAVMNRMLKAAGHKEIKVFEKR